MPSALLPSALIESIVSQAMHLSALRALEFERIVEAVAGFALTPMGAARLARLAPSTDLQKVGQLLAATG